MSAKCNWRGDCMTCKFFEQGKSCSFCGHPDQPDKSYKSYVYYTFSCVLWNEGIAKSRVDYMSKIKNKNGKI